MPRRNYPVKKGPSKRKFKLPSFKKKVEGNQKSRGAKKVFYAGIQFQSILEVNFYKYGKEELGYPLQYESYVTKLIPKLELTCFFCAPIPKSKDFFKRTNLLDIDKILATAYSPDFYFPWKNKLGEDIYIWIETKGHPTPEYLIKRKLFLAYIDKKYGNKAYFYEPHTLIQIKQAFDKIKDL